MKKYKTVKCILGVLLLLFLITYIVVTILEITKVIKDSTIGDSTIIMFLLDVVLILFVDCREKNEIIKKLSSDNK